MSKAEDISCADSHVCVALGARRPGSARNRDGRPNMAPREIDHVLPGPALSVRRQDGYTIVTISGGLDIACAPALREQLLGLLRPHASRIVVDLSGVTSCDASGLAVLVGARRRARLLNGVLRLAAPAPPVAAVLLLTGLDVRFEIFATVPAATRAPPANGPDKDHEAERAVARAPEPGFRPGWRAVS